MLLIVAYALSPIDLIPDFVPVLGYLDDLIIIPAGIVLALKLIPPGVMDEARQRAREAAPDRRAGLMGVILIAAIWILAILLCALLVGRILLRSKA